MRDLLSLQRSLFRTQKLQIGRALESASPAFRAYEARYRRRTSGYQSIVSYDAVIEAVHGHDIVYVGDYHTLRAAQEQYLALVVRALEAGRRVVMALEFVEGRQQPSLDAFAAGKITERRLATELGHVDSPWSLWRGFVPLLRLAKQEQISVIGIDRRASGTQSLRVRDGYAGERIASAALAADRPLVLVLVGQYHVAPPHLPAAVRRALGETERRHLVVYQNCEGAYWKLARRGLASSTQAVRVRDGELCLIHTSPVLCQQSFLDSLEREPGDEPISERAAAERFRDLAKLIGRAVGVPVEAPLKDIEVFTAASGDFLTHARRRGRFSGRELTELKRCALSREGLYVPRARLAYLGSLSLNHAAEEAAHFVRHVAIGDAMFAPRRIVDAFYSRCLEEAIGFAGSKLINPRRRAPTLEDWLKTFRTAEGELRHVAAFVIAHKSIEGAAWREAPQLVPLHQGRLFHAVSHALGYQLGERLYAALEQHLNGARALGNLFRDPFPDAQSRYFTWLKGDPFAETSPREKAMPMTSLA